MSQSIAEALVNVRLHNLAYNYYPKIWQKWKESKDLAFEDPEDPFVGGPMSIHTCGVRAVGLTGNRRDVQVDCSTRLRLGELSEESVLHIQHVTSKRLCHLAASGTCNDKDVVHPEYVDDYKTNRKNNPMIIANKLGLMIVALDAVFHSEKEGEDIQNLTIAVKEALNGANSDLMRVINFVVRAAWIMPDATDRPWQEPDRLRLATELVDCTAQLVLPTLRLFLADLEAGMFN